MERSRQSTLSQRSRVTHRQQPVKTAQKLHGHPLVTPEERFRMISDAAYFKAEKRGFAAVETDVQERDWFEAEAEIDALLKNLGSLPS